MQHGADIANFAGASSLSGLLREPHRACQDAKSQAKSPVGDVFKHIELADGRVWMLPSGVDTFAGDLSEQEQKLVWATHIAPDADLFNQKVEGTARSNPNFSASSRNVWAPPQMRSKLATCRCSRSRTSYLP